jgi:hypothetical protein
MRFAFLVVAGAGVGALAAFAIPTSTVQSASSTIEAYGTAVGHLPHDLADLNPIRMAYDVVAQRIREGNTPEQLGFKPSPLTLKPFVMPTSSFDFNQNRYPGTYAQNPAAWRGAPRR